jgi:hypothetical protein
MADITRYVDKDANDNGTGITNALTGTDCAVRTLVLAEALGVSGGPVYLDCVTNTQNYYIVCGSNHSTNHNEDTGATAFIGWTANSSYMPIVTTDANSKAGMSWSTTKYRGPQISHEGTSHLKVDGLQFARYYLNSNSTQSIVKNCFLKTTSNSCFDKAAMGDVFIINCIMLNASGSYATVYSTNRYNTIYIYNSVLVNTNTSSASYNVLKDYRAVAYIKNTYGHAAGTGATFRNSNGTTTNFSFTNAVSSDAQVGSSNGCQSNIAYSTTSGTYFSNVGSGTEDFTISSSSALYNQGATISESAPLDYTTDMLGTSRPQSTAWDVGPYELSGGGGSSSAVIFNPYDEVII